MADVRPLTAEDPTRLGAYELTGRLGEGGQGIVYLGRGSVETVAVKLLHARLMEDAAARARFVREVEVTTRVARFCTAQVLHAGMVGDRPYIVSEYVPGPSLHELVRVEGPRHGAALDRLAINTATALAAIHRAGVVHRDFKPGNVLMGPDGPVVIDFGIARALDGAVSPAAVTSQVVGTPAYMAPEQFGEGEVGRPADLFAWASTIVYAATGEPAFGQRSLPRVMHRILNDAPDIGALDGPLRELVAACLAKDPGRRPGARELVDRLLGNGAQLVESGQDVSSPVASAPGSEPAAHPEEATRTMPARSRDARTAVLPALGRPSVPGPGGRPPASPGSAAAQPPSRRKRGRIVAGIAVAVAVIAAASVGIGALVGRRDSGNGDRGTAGPTARQTPRHGGAARSGTAAPRANATGRVRPTRPVRRNPHTAPGLCGPGFRVLATHGVGGATAYLLYNRGTGANCVVTMVPRSSGPAPMNATLRVKGGASRADPGRSAFYAGPVRLPARGKCVRWGGSFKAAGWTSGWSHCRA